MIGFLKCDAEGCDHQHEIKAMTEDLIGTPCPACGADLLTREDYEAGKNFEALKKLMQGLGVLMADDANPADAALQMTINPHKGATNIKIEPIRKDHPQ